MVKKIKSGLQQQIKSLKHKHQWTGSPSFKFCMRDGCNMYKDDNGKLFSITEKNMAKAMDVCECGHVLKNHVIDAKKQEASSSLDVQDSTCKHCDCSSIVIQ